MLNILFMGTPDFAKESLEAVYNAGHKVIGVVTNPDKPKGRGMKFIASPVKEYAIEKNIPVYQPLKVKKNQEFIEHIRVLQPDVICVVAYGKILPQELLDIPKLGSINVHGSLLPAYRGAAPIQWAVLNGDKQTGITTMYMDAGMDTGDIILKQTVTIDEEETTGELWERLSKIGGQLLVDTLDLIEKGVAPREKQPENFTVAPMLNKEMAEIHWNEKTALEIKNLVRGLNPMMGAYTYIQSKKIKFWKVRVLSYEQFITDICKDKFSQSAIQKMPNGSVLLANDKQGLFLKAQDAVIEAIDIQAEGTKKMSAKDYLRGNPLI